MVMGWIDYEPFASCQSEEAKRLRSLAQAELGTVFELLNALLGIWIDLDCPEQQDSDFRRLQKYPALPQSAMLKGKKVCLQ